MSGKKKCLFLFFFMFVLAACGKKETEDGPKLSPTITAREKLFDLSSAKAILAEDGLYYSDVRTVAGLQSETTVYRRREGQEAEPLASFSPDQLLIRFFTDSRDGIYYLYEQAEISDEETRYLVWLRKDDSAGAVVYRTLLDEAAADPKDEETVWEPPLPEEMSKWYGISAGAGAADEEGRLCLYNAREAKLLLFDAAGNAAGETDCPSMEPANSGKEGLLTAGGDCYFYSLGQKKAAIRKVDFSTGTLSSWTILPFSPDEVVFLSGCGEEDADSIFVGTGQALYLYRLPDASGNRTEPFQETEELILWRAVPLQGSSVLQALRHGVGYQVLWSNHITSQLLQIENREEASDKQVIRLGIAENAASIDGDRTLLTLVNGFNESSLLYQIEMVPYEREDLFLRKTLQLELLKGEGPDIMNDPAALTLPINDLAAKGVFEDLNAYLARSSVLERDDILPRVLEAGSYEDKLICLIPHFYIETQVVRQGYTRNGGWTTEDFFAYCAKYPDVPVNLSKVSAISKLGSLVDSNSSTYINRAKKECYFDTARFVRLMESVKSLDLSGYGGDYLAAYLRPWGIEFCDGKFLTETYTIHNPDQYVLAARCLDGYGEIAGAPTETGEPHYIMRGRMPFAINSQSKCKEGAWAFLEYVMTFDYKEEGLEFCFPSNKKMFEAYLVPNRYADFVPGKKLSIYWTDSFTGESFHDVPFPKLTEEDKNAIRFMADHMYPIDNPAYYLDIIREEASYYYAGDKSAEDVARLIQNRVNLYLQE